MKELVKQEIMNAMNAVLNFQRMTMLEKVIHQSFHNVEIKMQNKENQNIKTKRSDASYFRTYAAASKQRKIYQN